MKHTPGDWKVEIAPEGYLNVVAGDFVVAFIGDLEETSAEDHFNADLIAAAPVMLEALEVVYKDWQLTIVRDAIAKAKGEKDQTYPTIEDLHKAKIDITGGLGSEEYLKQLYEDGEQN